MLNKKDTSHTPDDIVNKKIVQESNTLKKSQLDIDKISKELSKSKSKKACQDSIGINRAAKLLLALGTEQSAEVIKHLKNSEIEPIMYALSQITKIDTKERDEVLDELNNFVANPDGEGLQGGTNEARKLLEASFGQNAADEMMRKINYRDFYADFSFLESIEAPLLASVLSEENSQVVAVALSYMNPKIAAEIMRNFSKNFCSEVALRLAKSTKIHPESIQNLAKVLRSKFEEQAQETHSNVGGAKPLARILNHIGRDYENQILESISENIPELVEEVRENLYTIEELLQLSHKEMRLLVERVGDDLILAKALRGLHQDLRIHFFNSMSQNRAADILDDIESRGPIHVNQIHDARKHILDVARMMDNSGEICIKKDKEEYI